MKRIVIVLSAVTLLWGCGQSNEQASDANAENAQNEDGVYGASFTEASVMSIDDVVSQMETAEEVEGQIEGKVSSVCKNMGCWLKVTKANGEEVFVEMKDHDFSVPKDCEGKTAIINGVASKKVTSVEDLKHYAKDGGKSDEEIAQITEPKEDVVIVASGVILK